MSEPTKFEQEVLEFFDTNTAAADYLFSQEGHSKLNSAAFSGITDLPFSELHFCESRGGSEGDGEEQWAVFQFKNGEQIAHIIFEGGYTSFFGSEYDRCYLVTPETIQVNAWRYTPSGKHIYQ